MVSEWMPKIVQIIFGILFSAASIFVLGQTQWLLYHDTVVVIGMNVITTIMLNFIILN